MLKNIWIGSTRLLQVSSVFIKNGFHFLNVLDLLNEKKTAERLRKTFEELGGVYVKFGQLIASMPNIFPTEYVKEMEKCLDSLKPLPFSIIHKILKKELQSDPKKYFTYIDPKPIAQASIAQIHRAKLHTNEEIVLKIQKPNIVKEMQADFSFIYILSWLIENISFSIAKKALTNMVNDFYHTMLEEIDFRQEVKNMEIFRTFLEDIQESNVIVPKVYLEFCTKKIIAMEWLKGVTLTNIKSVQELSDNPRELCLLTLNTWMKSLIFSPIFHADMHTGNLIVLEDNKLAFIDFGIVGKLQKDTWEHVFLLFKSIHESDYLQISTTLVTLNVITEQDININEFTSEIQKIFEDFDSLQSSMKNINIVDAKHIDTLIIKIINITEDYGLKLPREFLLLFKQILYFDKYLHILAPDLNMMDYAQNNIQYFSGELHSDLSAGRKNLIN